MKRYAARRDANEPEIVEALRAAGCAVELMDRPVDLLVWTPHLGTVDFADDTNQRDGALVLLEVKDPNRRKGGKDYGRDGLTPRQEKWHDDWPGDVVIVWTVEDALRAVGA